MCETDASLAARSTCGVTGWLSHGARVDTPEAGSYARRGCFAGPRRRRLRTPPTRRRTTAPSESARSFQPFGPGGPDLAALPIAGITQRRMAILLGALVAAWIVLLFARQVGDASAASSRAEAMVVENAARHAEIAGPRTRARADPAAAGSSSCRRAPTAWAATRRSPSRSIRTRRRCRPTRRARPPCGSALRPRSARSSPG